MKTYGASGYVIKASELIPLMPNEFQSEFKKAIADGDIETIDELSEHLPDEFPVFEGAFVLSDEDEATDNLEVGEMYINFAESDLYEKIPKPGLGFLESKGITPAYERWVVWG